MKKHNNKNLGHKKCEPEYFLFNKSAAITIAGAINKFPINCGSIENPFGCGNPNIEYVHPEHIKVYSRPTPTKSKIHCKKHIKQINNADPIKLFQKISRNPTSLNKLFRLKTA